jgi:hypothetical protein
MMAVGGRRGSFPKFNLESALVDISFIRDNTITPIELKDITITPQAKT